MTDYALAFEKTFEILKQSKEKGLGTFSCTNLDSTIIILLTDAVGINEDE